MKHLLFCILLITGCKTNATYNDNPDVAIGTAYNMKSGATLINDQGTYQINGLQMWDSIYLHKKLKVTGRFTLHTGEDAGYIEINDTIYKFQAQALPKYYAVADAKWELYSSD